MRTVCRSLARLFTSALSYITRQYSSKMRTARLPTVCAVAATRCQYPWGIGTYQDFDTVIRVPTQGISPSTAALIERTCPPPSTLAEAAIVRNLEKKTTCGGSRISVLLNYLISSSSHEFTFGPVAIYLQAVVSTSITYAKN